MKLSFAENDKFRTSPYRDVESFRNRNSRENILFAKKADELEGAKSHSGHTGRSLQQKRRVIITPGVGNLHVDFDKISMNFFSWKTFKLSPSNNVLKLPAIHFALNSFLAF